MAYAIQPASKIEVQLIQLSDPWTSLPLTFEVRYCGQTTGVGPAQNGVRCRPVSVTVAATDTWAQVASKIKAAVDADVAAG